MLLKACIKSEKEEKGMAWRPLGAAYDAANAARLRPCCRALQGAVAGVAGGPFHRDELLETMHRGWTLRSRS